MDFVTLGLTGITVNKNGFGALPIQRVGESEAVCLLKKAFQSGITFFDTARDYTDSEKKIGLALSDVRDEIFIATKTSAKDAQGFWEQLDTSMKMLKTDRIDIYQFRNPSFCPRPGDDSGLYDAMLEAKAQGRVNHIGLTNHRLDIAREAAESGLYETIQYPMSYLSSSDELDLVRICGEMNIGFIAMKALAGGVITDSAVAYTFFRPYGHVIPIWGIQTESELDEFISYHDDAPEPDENARRVMERDAEELKGDFCRGCGYCLPCPAKIHIPTSARMSVLIRRAHVSFYNSELARESMKRVEDCTGCGHCMERCPYGLEVPRLIREGLADFRKLEI